MPQRSAPLSIAGIVILAVVAEGLLTLMDAMIKELSGETQKLYLERGVAWLRHGGRRCLRTVGATRPTDA